MDKISSKARTKRLRRGRFKGQAPQHFSSYLSFGAIGTASAGCFLCIYLVLMVGFMPLLGTDYHGEDTKPLEVLESGLARAREKEKLLLGEVSQNLRERFQKFRAGKGMTDKNLQEAAMADFKPLRQRQAEAKLEAEKGEAAGNGGGDPQGAILPGNRPGVIVLGMHRSGTSMLSGLLVEGYGYEVGGPLIGAAFDNKKGFFERIDVVLQNDEFLNAQGENWAAGVISFDPVKALDQKNAQTITFQNGEKGLSFLNDAQNVPWLQKDPRMCITLKTWLKLLKAEPAILFSYRHPLEVARSLQKRENFVIEHGLRLWIVYNMRAIQNSNGLCRIITSNDSILKHPLAEVQRVSDELTNTCGVPEPKKGIEQEDVDRFIDPNLQHGDRNEGIGRNMLKLEEGCEVPEFEGTLEKGTPAFEREQKLYQISMTMYCDMQNGKAFKPDYQWPVLT